MFKNRPPVCPYCSEETHIRKHGKAPSKIQRYRCLSCTKTFQSKYIYLVQQACENEPLAK